MARCLQNEHGRNAKKRKKKKLTRRFVEMEAKEHNLPKFILKKKTNFKNLSK